MVEIFGARGQDLTYPEMKWWTDHMQVSGVNFLIPHSFNPRSPYDTDCPPYFYNGGFEPRWPLYRVFADYTSRLSLMLTGGRHVCPVALLFGGNTLRVGKAVTPEDMTTALQDAQFDCDWLPFEVFESKASLGGKELKLHGERYRVLVVPPVEVIPYATLAKAKEFFDAGGVVVGYGFLPSKSATLGKTSADIAALRRAIWGDDAKPGLTACKTNAAGGRSYLLSQTPTPEEVTQALADAGVHPTLEVLEGKTDGWLHVLHRVKAGRDVFFVANQNHQGAARTFKFRATAAGEPEFWDAMRNEITAIPFQRIGDRQVEFSLTLEPLETRAVGVPADEDRPADANRTRHEADPRADRHRARSESAGEAARAGAEGASADARPGEGGRSVPRPRDDSGRRGFGPLPRLFGDGRIARRFGGGESQRRRGRRRDRKAVAARHYPPRQGGREHGRDRTAGAEGREDRVLLKNRWFPRRA